MRADSIDIRIGGDVDMPTQPRIEDWPVLSDLFNGLEEWMMICRHGLGLPCRGITWADLDRQERIVCLMMQVDCFNPFAQLEADPPTASRRRQRLLS